MPAHGYQAAARGTVTGMLGRGGLRRRSASIEWSSPSRYQQAAAPVGRPQLRQAPIAAGPQPHRDGGLGPGAGSHESDVPVSSGYHANGMSTMLLLAFLTHGAANGLLGAPSCHIRFAQTRT